MKKKILGIGATVLILSAAVFAGCGLTGTRIRFGAAGLGGTYHVFADTFAGLITAGKEKCTVEVKTTAGSAANLRLLSDGYIQMAVAQNDLTNDAYYAAGTFENSRKYADTARLRHFTRKAARLWCVRTPALKAWMVCKGKQSVSVRTNPVRN